MNKPAILCCDNVSVHWSENVEEELAGFGILLSVDPQIPSICFSDLICSCSDN
jgi:hypothetical protein